MWCLRFPKEFSHHIPEQNYVSVTPKEGRLLATSHCSVPSPQHTLFCVLLCPRPCSLISSLPEDPCELWPTGKKE